MYGKDVFKITDNFITVVLPFDKEVLPKDQNASVNASVNATVKLSATQRQIIDILKNNSGITIKGIAEKLEKNESTIVRNIGKLKNQGIIERVGSDKTGYWKIN